MATPSVHHVRVLLIESDAVAALNLRSIANEKGDSTRITLVRADSVTNSARHLSSQTFDVIIFSIHSHGDVITVQDLCAQQPDCAVMAVMDADEDVDLRLQIVGMGAVVCMGRHRLATRQDLIQALASAQRRQKRKQDGGTTQSGMWPPEPEERGKDKEKPKPSSAAEARKQAKFLRAIGKYAEAARLLLEMHLYREGAEFLVLAEDWDRAAACYGAVGDRLNQMKCLFGAGREREAFALMAKTTDPAEMPALLTELGQHFHAGLLYERGKAWDPALSAYLLMAQDSKHFPDGCRRVIALAHALGHHQKVAAWLRERIGNNPPSEENLILFTSYVKLLISANRLPQAKQLANKLIAQEMVTPDRIAMYFDTIKPAVQRQGASDSDEERGATGSSLDLVVPEQLKETSETEDEAVDSKDTPTPPGGAQIQTDTVFDTTDDVRLGSVTQIGVAFQHQLPGTAEKPTAASVSDGDASPPAVTTWGSGAGDEEEEEEEELLEEFGMDDGLGEDAQPIDLTAFEDDSHAASGNNKASGKEKKEHSDKAAVKK